MAYEKLTKFKKQLSLPKGSESPFNNLIRNIFVAFISILICTFFLLFKFYSKDDIASFSYEPGGIWSHKTLIAEYSYPIFKDKDTYLKELERARENVLPVFIENPNVKTFVLNNFDSLFQRLLLQNFTPQVFEEVLPTFTSKNTFYQLTPEKNSSVQKAKAITSKFLSNAYLSGVVDIPVKNIKSQEIVIVDNYSNKEKILPKRYITDKLKLINDLKILLQSSFKEDLVELFVELVNKVQVPSLIYSEELTNKRIQIAEKSVPRTIGYVKAGEVIIQKGKTLTQDDILKLKSYEKVKLLEKSQSITFSTFIGSFLNVLSIYGIIFIYLLILRKKIFNDLFQFGLINICFVLLGMFSWLSVVIQTELPIRYLIVLPSISILLAIVFDSRTAFYSTITFSLLIASIRGNDFETALSLMLAGVVGAYSVRDIQSRTQMFRSMVFVALGFILPIFAFHFQKAATTSNIFEHLSFALLNSILSPVITYGLLFFIENVSNITTDLKLKEYDDINHPLLQKLSEVAPGTYQHTLSLALLAESCAEAIGANRLLTRVGVYFHDIGKIFRPEYFVENQIEVENKHEFISPEKSAEIIKDHVIKGIELAKQYRLPERIIDFIPMHHGTSLIKHFYAKALEKEGNVDESLYRYPGPKPNSKETVIVMICDSAEAMSRLPAKSKEDLSQTLEKMILNKLLDGQFDESDISMKDLKVIQEVCVRQLYGILHPRVEYKEIPQNDAPTTNVGKQ